MDHFGHHNNVTYKLTYNGLYRKKICCLMCTVYDWLTLHKFGQIYRLIRRPVQNVLMVCFLTPLNTTTNNAVFSFLYLFGFVCLVPLIHSSIWETTRVEFLNSFITDLIKLSVFWVVNSLPVLVAFNMLKWMPASQLGVLIS